jgi:hypothetical protein
MARTAAAQVMEINRNETPEEKFYRLATSRVNHILDHLRILGNLASPNYRYSDQQIARIFGAIQAAVDETQALFRPRRKAEFRLEVANPKEANQRGR